jgi:predicted HTH domain antitoxin
MWLRSLREGIRSRSDDRGTRDYDWLSEIMTVTIPDDILRQAGLTEADALFEFACSLFDGGRLGLSHAARLAGLDRVQLEGELRKRGIAVWRPTRADIADEAAALKKLRN